MEDINHEFWDKPYKDIQNFDDFLNIIINWDGLYDDYPLYNIYGMIDIFSCSLQYMKKNFSEDEIQKTIDLLKPEEFNYFIKMGHEIENHLNSLGKDTTTSPTHKPEREYTLIDTSNPFQSIRNYDDFTGLIENWGTVMK